MQLWGAALKSSKICCQNQADDLELSSILPYAVMCDARKRYVRRVVLQQPVHAAQLPMPIRDC